MFKKKPQIKNLSPLRSSDRRRLAHQIIAEFDVDIPSAVDLAHRASSLAISTPLAIETSASILEEEPDDSPQAPTLSSIRNSLLPENSSSARFTTHAGVDNKVVSGTVYIGSHPGLEERILWLQWGEITQRLYPTIYTLWANPGLVPLILTPGLVMDKMMTGADLMTPGLYGGPPWPARATRNSIVAVARLECPSVPVWLGVCEIDVSALGTVYGVKGKAIDGVHWAGDEVWNWSANSSREHAFSGGRDLPDKVEGWGIEFSNVRMVESKLGELAPGWSNRGVSITQASSDDHSGRADEADKPDEKEHEKQDEEDTEKEKDDDREPTPQEIDEAFQQAFVYSLYNAKKNGSPPCYGLDLPGIQPSYMVDKMIQPHLKSQSPHYTIKKTSWKNTKKFIKHLAKQGLVKAKDRNGGETIILDIDFEDPQIKQFVPYNLPKPKLGETTGHVGNAKTGTGVPPPHQYVTLQHLYRASSKLVPDLIPSKTDYYTRSQLSDYIRNYVQRNQEELSVNASSRRFIKLNPFIANNILGSSKQTASDTQILANGEIARDALQKRVLEDDHLCMPFWVLLGSDQTWDPADRSMPKPKSGSPPKVTITIEKRTGTKTVTIVTGLENFNVSPQAMAPELQKKCASSASVQQASGLKPGTMEIVVQGDQRDAVIKEAGKRGVRSEWFEVVDKTKKKGK
jgi:translation initiation factor 2D